MSINILYVLFFCSQFIGLCFTAYLRVKAKNPTNSGGGGNKYRFWKALADYFI